MTEFEKKKHFDPTDDLPEDIKKKIDAEVDKSFTPTSSDILLQKDSTPAGQNFAIVSFCGPTCPQKHEKFCLKIKAVYDTQDAAMAAAKRFQEIDATFVQVIVPLGEWGVYPPDLTQIQNQEHVDAQLNTILKEHEKESERSRWYHEARKNLLKSNVDVNKIINEKLEAVKEEGVEEEKSADPVLVEESDPWLDRKKED